MKPGHTLAVMLAFLLVSNSSTLGAEEHPKLSDKYRGFCVDYSEVCNNPNFTTLRATMNKQIDMVMAVGISTNLTRFFQEIPIKVHAGKESYAGQYTGKSNKAVEVTSAFLTRGRKPLLLHELLHAFHDQQLAGGYKNRDVLMYFTKAKTMNAYAASSHMMANVKEFFASAATAYLFGVTVLEPFQREKIRTAQPEFYQYLGSLFGPDAGKYQGSLR